MYRFLVKTSLVLSLFASTFVYADPREIFCPSISTIQQAAQSIDRAHVGPHGWYDVTSSVPAFYESGLPWFVGVDHVYASSSEEAIREGKKTMQETSVRRAYTTRDGNACFYRSDNDGAGQWFIQAWYSDMKR